MSSISIERLDGKEDESIGIGEMSTPRIEAYEMWRTRGRGQPSVETSQYVASHVEI
jgi:hypothetical protein